MCSVSEPPGRRLASATDARLAKAAVADKRASVTGDPEACGAITRLSHACVIAASFTICPEPPSFALFHSYYPVLKVEIFVKKAASSWAASGFYCFFDDLWVKHIANLSFVKRFSTDQACLYRFS